MKAVIATHCTQEYGECPDFFIVDVTVELIEKIEHLTKLCKGGILSINADSHEGQWGSPETEINMRLQGQELAVTAHGFWFQIYRKNQDGQIETDQLDIKTLKADVEAGKEIMFYGDDSDELEITYEESLIKAVV